MALGFTLAALSLIVLIPLAALVLRAASIGPAEFFKIASDQGVYPKTLDYKKAYTLQFLPKGQ